MTSEFELIQRYFKRRTLHTDLDGGDDAALISLWPGSQLVVSTDMLVEGTHFLPGTDARDLGWKTLAVNVSDLAAMAAEPRWALLAMALPEADEDWLEAFSEGVYECAAAFGVDLAGGDTTRGPRTLCVTILGEVPHGRAVTRAGARPGDEVWISGQPGRAALGLAHLRGTLRLPDTLRDACIAAQQRPQPRVALGLALRDVATAMLDVSDGLLGDLAHLLDQSGVGACIVENALPVQHLANGGVDPATLRQAVLAGGDDYELLFTAPREAREQIASLSDRLALPLHCIGHILPAGSGLQLQTTDGRPVPTACAGYDHFR